ncbi:DUF4893 domain-containing protein [Nitratireductor kimnyeongensis]|uniref:DUF4893 domain-containing protein n=1 Tax=Nitratireductor kimnyeongensis TaxID=430679 RepID=A0ABW0T8R2_9HYPH|nr:DUF4893 domain-containing protein [Nitratireductor kimnyeongensis]QZZ35835.1 DUF4893 domain-containing protein [Nitratireductor kimnyeongensis]
MHRIFLPLLAFGLSSVPVFAQSLVQEKLDMERAGFEKDTVMQDITYRDAARLDAYERIRAEAVKQAKSGGAASDVAILEEIEKRDQRSFDGFDLAGEWECRTIKAGGLVPLVVYDWFRCKVGDDGASWVLEKLTGSQRTRGRFYTDTDNRLIYLGSYYVSTDRPPSYGSGRESDQVAYVFRGRDDGWRMEFPAPERESVLDILEFRQAR